MKSAVVPLASTPVRVAILATCLVLAVPAARTLAAEPPAAPEPSNTTALSAAPAPQVDPAAMALLKKAQTAMMGLTSYSAECWTTRTYDPIPGKTEPTRYEMATLTAEKPNLMHYDFWIMKVDAQGKWTKQKEAPTDISVCDGKTEWRQERTVCHIDTLAAFLAEQDGNQLEDLDAHQEPWTGFYSTITSPYERTEYIRTNGEQFEKQFAGQFAVRRDGTEDVEGVVCDKVFTHSVSLFGSQTAEESTTYYIGPDGLLRREVAHVQYGTKPGYTRDAILRGIKTNFVIADPKALYTYTPPQGVTLTK